MPKRKTQKESWHWLVTDLPFEQDDDNDAAAPCSGHAGTGVLAFGAGVLTGVLGFMLWQRQQERPILQPQPQPQPQPEPQVVYVRAPEPQRPRPVQLRVLKTQAEYRQLMESARLWTRFSSEEDDKYVAQMVWCDCWPGAHYPGPPQPDDHPSVTQAHTMITMAIAVARASWASERAMQAKAKESDGQPVTAVRSDAVPTKLELGLELDYQTAPIVASDRKRPNARPIEHPLTDVPTRTDTHESETTSELRRVADIEHSPTPEARTSDATEPIPKPSADMVEGLIAAGLHNAATLDATPEPSADTIETLTAPNPVPGHFFRIPPEFADFSLGDLAVLAVCCAAYQACIAKGCAPDKAEQRAHKFAGAGSVREAYKALLVQSKWNAGRLFPLREGTLLWLPPIRTPAIRDRNPQRQVSLDPQPWADGSSRIDPPLSAAWSNHTGPALAA